MDVSVIHTSKVGGTVLLTLNKVFEWAVGVVSVVHTSLPLLLSVVYSEFSCSFEVQRRNALYLT